MFFFSVGLPIAFVGVLAVTFPAFETLLNHHPALEAKLLKAMAFNPFDPTR
jgi:hypothetical protein